MLTEKFRKRGLARHGYHFAGLHMSPRPPGWPRPAALRADAGAWLGHAIGAAAARLRGYAKRLARCGLAGGARRRRYYFIIVGREKCDRAGRTRRTRRSRVELDRHNGAF